MVSEVLCKGKPLESGSIDQTRHLGVGFLNTDQPSQTAPSPDFISTAEQRWVQCTRLSLGSALGLNQFPRTPSKAESSECFIPNSDFYSPITFSHSHLPSFPTFSSVSLSSPSSCSLPHSSEALGLSFYLTKAKSSAGRTQSGDSPHHAWHRAWSCLKLQISVVFPFLSPSRLLK